MDKNSVSKEQESSGIYRLITVVSIAVPLVVAILLFMPAKLDLASEWVYFLPHLNAVINFTASLALIAGLFFIKSNMINYHRTCMTIAFALGAIFLVSYVVYHASAESTSYGGEGTIRTVYFIILISHIILAAVALFPILLAYYYGHKGMVEKHRKIVRYAYPIWLYVTISGVVVYWMISPYYNH
ncbi:DUF420 domain-containing protein [Echinicola strongylocentroti]|uniref:DUF420 domain-containing protein n=1 Tax=Echinicola strongylocentroti TaxID=1795355 RepID=A0A2Z4ILV8_9BACT|nr:DUF420 domain-containing protein [Echinicola strongylocentroti]AWW31546.1 DUF420 domain-containing protein [Echinicola strongylocentroti]